MMEDIRYLLEELSSTKVAVRKKAIAGLKRHLHQNDAYIARLCLQYISEHDPCYTVRNIARQAFYAVGDPPSDGNWERHHLFHSE